MFTVTVYELRQALIINFIVDVLLVVYVFLASEASTRSAPFKCSHKLKKS